MTERNKNLAADICSSAAILIFAVSTAVNTSTVMQLNQNLEALSNDISEIRSEIRISEKSREEEFEKRFKLLSDKIAEIDEKFEEVYNEINTQTIISEEEIPQPREPESIEHGEIYSKERLPVGIDTNRYDCEPHTFGRGTAQYRLQSACYTDEKGLRYFLHNDKKYYCVAMGGAYGIDIGDTWDVTLECGSTFGIILSDYQHSTEDVDPNDFGEIYERDRYGNVIGILRNYDGEPVCHVLEFVAEMSRLDRYILGAGTTSALEEFGGLYGDGGNIIDISYKGRAWNA